jgi:hypothetical protein
MDLEIDQFLERVKQLYGNEASELARNKILQFNVTPSLDDLMRILREIREVHYIKQKDTIDQLFCQSTGYAPKNT